MRFRICGLGLRVKGFRGLGFRVWGFRGLGFKVSAWIAHEVHSPDFGFSPIALPVVLRPSFSGRFRLRGLACQEW